MVDQRASQASSKAQAVSGPVPEKKIPPVCPLHNGQCSAYRTAILSTPSIQELRRCSCARAADAVHNENVLLGTARGLCEQFHLHG